MQLHLKDSSLKYRFFNVCKAISVPNYKTARLDAFLDVIDIYVKQN